MQKKVAVVTGASRGLGRGIARALSRLGFTVFATSRSGSSNEGSGDDGQAVGQIIPIKCDHSDDAQIAALINEVRSQTGRLDILVNNAAQFNAADLTRPGGFWEKPLSMADMITVGLRSNYVAAYYAAPLMIQTGGALIANISYYGAVSYHYAAAYGAAKAGTDKMTFDMGLELKSVDVAAVSIWPGLVLTDELRAIPQDRFPASMRADLPNWETPDFTGMVIERLWRDPDRMKLSGETLIAAELGRRYALSDIDGKRPRLYSDRLGHANARFIGPNHR